MGEPILISRKCIGLAAHSGIPSSVVSRGGKVHVVWAEATEPDEKVPGVPTFVVTYDRATGHAESTCAGGLRRPAERHPQFPSITMDSQGYLHVLAGTHGKPFQYARSLQPNDAVGRLDRGGAGGQGPAADVHRPGVRSRRHAALDVSAMALRRSASSPQPPGNAGLPAQTPGQPWEEPRILVVPPFSEYSVYYHRLTIDPQGRLFLSYDYWSTFWFYRNDHPGRRRSLLTSPTAARRGRWLRPAIWWGIPEAAWAAARSEISDLRSQIRNKSKTQNPRVPTGAEITSRFRYDRLGCGFRAPAELAR